MDGGVLGTLLLSTRVVHPLRPRYTLSGPGYTGSLGMPDTSAGMPDTSGLSMPDCSGLGMPDCPRLGIRHPGGMYGSLAV